MGSVYWMKILDIKFGESELILTAIIIIGIVLVGLKLKGVI